MKILCSTGAFITRANGRNHRLIEVIKREIACDGIEFMMYDSWYDSYQEIISDIKQMNLYIPVMHVEKSVGELLASGEVKQREKAIRLFIINCEMAKALGAHRLVLHLWNGLISDQYIKRNMEGLACLLSIAKQYELELTIENVVCNQKDPLSHWKELRAQYPEVKFTFDTKMAAFHNQIDCIYDSDWDWLWSERHITHLHLNDYAGEYMEWNALKTLHIGEGKIDFLKLFEFIKNKGEISYVTLEATSVNKDGSLQLSKMNESINKVRSLL